MADSDPVRFADESDAEMAAAMARARATFKYFWRELSWEHRRIIPAHGLSGVKLAFSVEEPTAQSAVVEHLWIDEVDFDGQEVRGRLMSAPQWVSSFSEGDEVTKPFSDVSDWLFTISARAYGGFTVQVLRSRMSPEEQQAHDATWGLDFGPSGQVRLVYAKAPEKPPGFFSRLLGRGDSLERAKERALLDHPMSVNAEEKFREQLQAQPSLVHEADEKGWTALHREALAGNRNVAALLLELGADREARTLSGQTARDLALAIGWPETVAVLDAGI